MPDKKQILIVDSDSRLREGLSAVFNKRGVISSVSQDLDHAFNVIKTHPCELVLVDLNTPGLEIYNFTEQIQELAVQPLVMVMTGINAVKTALRTLQNQSNPECVERFNDDDPVLENIEKVLQQKKRSNQLIELSGSVTGERYRYLVENSPDIIYALDAEGRFVFVNNTIRSLLGFDQSDLIGKSYKKLVYQEDLSNAEYHFNERRTGGRATVFKKIKIRSNKNGGTKGNSGKKNGYLFMSLKANGIYERFGNSGENKFIGTYGTIIDISTQHYPVMKERAILENIEDGYFETDIAGNLVYFNNALCNIVGSTYDELVGKNYREFVDKRTALNVYHVFNRIYDTGQPSKPFDWVLLAKNNRELYVETAVSPIRGKNQAVTGFCGIARNVSERKHKEAKIAYIAQHDYLTGLYNRNVFDERLAQLLRQARRYQQEIALLFIDIDKFKTVNDNYGHETGDKLLIEIARRLKSSLRETDYVFRLGGDEFTTILNNPQNLVPEAVARKLRLELSLPYELNGYYIDFVSASIGISIYPQHGHDAETLVRNADSAMYAAKKKRNRVTSQKLLVPGS